jgi:hypothetical protein
MWMESADQIYGVSALNVEVPQHDESSYVTSTKAPDRPVNWIRVKNDLTVIWNFDRRGKSLYPKVDTGELH